MSDGNVPVEASDRQSVLAQASPETERRSPRSLHNKEGAGPVRAGSPAVFTPQPPLTGLRGAGLRNPRHRLQGPGLYLPAFSFLPLSPPGFPQPQGQREQTDRDGQTTARVRGCCQPSRTQIPDFLMVSSSIQPPCLPTGAHPSHTGLGWGQPDT